ncbi:transketolase [Streptomyces sp. MP131-18]|uniref:transketolase n=1 Tax=Streptomyces sp. MP131-18 TaxID=1857892 RepID=UPI0009A1AD74|nr:transketolase [Streptomyces sp. MP131-18]ONK10463.1 Transketolase 2 [Streptomyces sp. MP131-18]
MTSTARPEAGEAAERPPEPAVVGQADLEALAHRIRHHIVDMCGAPEGGHLGGSMSAADILAVLYFSVLRVDPARPRHQDRDIFLLSKGHAAIALYATLAERGFLPVAELGGFGNRPGRLMGHPVTAVPGVDMPTGSLGHGLSLGIGFAMAARWAASRRRTFVLLGDGELQEGSCWEAVMAGAGHGVDNLVAIVDRNGLQLASGTEQVCPVEPLAGRWRGFGWEVREVDGHDHAALSDALAGTPWVPGSPSVVIAHTVKGRGLPFLAGKPAGHYVTLSAENRERAHRILDIGARRGGRA